MIKQLKALLGLMIGLSLLGVSCSLGGSNSASNNTSGTSCTVNSNCSTGQICQNGACVSQNTSCTSNADCPSGQICQNGSCVNNSTSSATVDGQVTLFGTTDSTGINISLLEISNSATTDASGNFSMSNVPQGTYTIQASYASPYQPKQRTGIAITGSGTFNVPPFSLKIGKLLTNNPSITTTTASNGIQITSNMSMVIYATQDGSLYSQPSNGSSPPLLIGSGMTGNSYNGQVNSFFYQITPDSSRILFLKGPTGGPYNLYSTSISTGSSILIDSGINQYYQITLDSSRVVYTKGTFTPDTYSSPTNYSSPIKIIAGASGIMTPDGSRIVYETNSNSALYSTSVNSNAGVLISSGVLSFQIAPNSKIVVYGYFGGGNAALMGIYSRSIDDSSQPIMIGGYDSEYDKFLITPDSSRVVYTDGYNLYSVPINGGSPIQLDTDPNREVGVIVQITPDSGYVVYSKGAYSGPYNLYSSPVGYSSPIEIDTGLSADMEWIQSVPPGMITSDSSKVVYVKGPVGGPYTLCTSSVNSATPTQIDTEVSDYPLISSDSSRIVYYKSSTSTLYSSPISSSSPVQIDTGTSGWGLTPDGSKILYCKNGVSPFGPADLYFRDIDASQNAHKFDDNGYSYNWGCINSNAISSDGSFFIYNRYTNLSSQNLDNGIFRVDFPAGW